MLVDPLDEDALAAALATAAALPRPNEAGREAAAAHALDVQAARIEEVLERAGGTEAQPLADVGRSRLRLGRLGVRLVPHSGAAGRAGRR